MGCYRTPLSGDVKTQGAGRILRIPVETDRAVPGSGRFGIGERRCGHVAVTSVYSAGACGTGTLSLALRYDANGNLCAQAATTPATCNQSGASKYAFDAENRLKTRDVTGGGQDTYTYDAHGTLVKRANADGTSTVYIGGIYEATYDAGGALTGTTKYYQAFGRTIAMRSSSVAACASAPCYLLADHLGSTVGMTDNSGNVLSTQKYWPYGAVRSGAREPDRQALHRSADRARRQRARPVQLQGAVLQHDAWAIRERRHFDEGWIQPLRLRARQPGDVQRSNGAWRHSRRRDVLPLNKAELPERRRAWADWRTRSRPM